MARLNQRACCPLVQNPESGKELPDSERFGIGLCRNQLIQMAQDPFAESVLIRRAKELVRLASELTGKDCLDPSAAAVAEVGRKKLETPVSDFVESTQNSV